MKELTRKEKNYIISRIFDKVGYDEDFSYLTEKQEEKLIDSILEKLRD